MRSWISCSICEVCRRHISISLIDTAGVALLAPARASSANKCMMSAKRAQRISCSHGPQQVLYDAEHDEPKEDADQTIADNGSAGSWAKILKDSFVKGEADLIAAVGDPRSAEVHPGGNGGAGTEH